MTNDKKPQNKKTKKPKKASAFDVNKSGLDIDKAEFQELILSNSNDPARSFYKDNY